MRYRSIHLCMWGDEKFRKLSPLQPSGQALWIYLLTNPNTNSIPGLYRIGELALAEELNWPLEAFREAFREVQAQGLAQADFCARVVYIPNAIKYNKPQSPNVIKNWHYPWGDIPECALKTEAYHNLKAFVEGLGIGFQEAFVKTIRKPIGKNIGNIDIEIDTDIETEQEPVFDFKKQNQKQKAITHLDENDVDKSKPFTANKNSGFEEFWKIYPRKKDRSRAQKIWLQKKPVLEVLIADVKNRMQLDPVWKEKKFIPYPSTYLANEKWLDELDLPKSHRVMTDPPSWEGNH